jgi:hypothetical protein
VNDIPEFAGAVKQFRTFLADSGLPDKVFWVFREDLWRMSRNQVLVRYPPSSQNLPLVQKVFAEGRERGLVQLNAVAATSNAVAAVVWYPKYPEEEVQGWGRGMKLTHTHPLPRGRTISWWCWKLMRLHPGFRQYQRRDILIGTRDWAAA